MIKRKISKTTVTISEVDKAEMLGMMAFEQLVGFIHNLDPELKPSEVINLAAFAVYKLPELFQENPELMERLKDMAITMKLKRSSNSN